MSYKENPSTSEYPLDLPVDSKIDRAVSEVLFRDLKVAVEAYADLGRVSTELVEEVSIAQDKLLRGDVERARFIVELSRDRTDYDGSNAISFQFNREDPIFMDLLSDFSFRCHAAATGDLDSVFERHQPQGTPDSLSTKSWGFARDTASIWGSKAGDTDGVFLVTWKEK